MAIETRIAQSKTVFGDWEVKEFIGSGSGGKTAVFRIVRRHEDWEENAALKVVNILEEIGKRETLAEDYQAEYEAERTELCKQAESEIHLMSRLKGNPHIVEYYDFLFCDYQEENVFGTDLFIRMELLESLREERKRKGEYNGDEVIKIGRDICKGLDFCHKSGVIHRDIKPANIFVTTFGSYKLGDFGIARMVDAGQKASTKMGTRAYAAPEQFMSSREKYDGRVDIYSLGLTLYELSNHNRLPFAASGYVRESEIQQRLMGKEFPAPENASPALAEVIKTACAFEAENRYASAEELEEALMAAEVGALPKESKQAAEKKKPSKQIQKKTKEKKTGYWLPAAAGGIVLAAVLLILFGVGTLTKRQIPDGQKPEDTGTPVSQTPEDTNPPASQTPEDTNPPASQTPEDTNPPASQSPEAATQGTFENLSVEEYKELFGEAARVVTSKETVAVITQTGDLYMWGNNEYGQVGCNNTEYQTRPVLIMQNVATVAMSEKHTAAITTDDKLYLWGCDESGEIGNDSLSFNENQTMPILVSTDIQKVALGEACSLALGTNGDLYSWGSGVANGMGLYRDHPVVIAHDMVDIATNGYASGAVNKDGELYTWGWNNISGRDWEDLGIAPAKIMDDVAGFYIGPTTAAAIKTNGDLYVWGENDFGQATYGVHPVLVRENVSSVSLSEKSSAAVTAAGDLYIWGKNMIGQDFNGGVLKTQYAAPEQFCDGVKDVVLGENHLAILKEDGKLYLCGANENGQIEDSDDTKIEQPVLAAADIESVSLGADTTWAVGSDGSFYSWGE